MVDMRMRKQYEVEPPDIKSQRTQILRVSIAATLKHAAINEKTRRFALDQEAGTRYFASRTEKTDFHIAQFQPEAPSVF
jgi:hypothetical protein